MVTIDMKTLINRPAEEVFAAFTDGRTQPQCDPGLLEARHVPDGPPCLGSKIVEVRRFLGRTSENVGEVIESEQNRRFVRRGSDGPMTFIGVITFEERPQGTLVRWQWRLEATGALRSLEPLLAFIMKRSANRLLLKLKRLLESGARIPASTAFPQPGSGIAQ
jgi:hypothetical protein